MKYKLIAVDLDGTLLNDESDMTERTKFAIIKAVDAGALFVTATGRAIQGAEFVNEQLSKDMPFIVFNGASVIMGKSRKILFSKFLDKALAKEAYDMGASRATPMVIWTDAGLRVSYDSKGTAEYKEYYKKYYYSNQKVIDDIDELEDERIYKIIWFGKRDIILKYQHEMNSHFAERVNCHTSLPEYLEFVSPDADKGAAMEEIGKVYGIDRSEMIAVGDGYNDISMIKYAGLGVAMGNAPGDVKAACDLVTLSNNHDGVAAVIEEYF